MEVGLCVMYVCVCVCLHGVGLCVCVLVCDVCGRNPHFTSGSEGWGGVGSPTSWKRHSPVTGRDPYTILPADPGPSHRLRFCVP